MKTIYQAVGENIRAKRLQSGLTLEDLAELSGLHASYIGQIERNSKKASLDTVAVLARGLNVPVRRLFFAEARTRRSTVTEKLEAILRLNDPRERKIILGVLRQLSRALRGST
ncbi:MAG: helix-turn-helix transcriptional regulator [Elusimicrobia bacterium]|nr:helix-turn-helix transcriptional regulator [Elusimicrobiota bacterium]